MELGSYMINLEDEDCLDYLSNEQQHPFDTFGLYQRSRTYDPSMTSSIAFPLSLRSLASGPLESCLSFDDNRYDTPLRNEELEPEEDYPGSSNYHLGFIPKGRVAYTFPMASKIRYPCFLKVVVNHNVAGLYIGKSGAHLKRLQSILHFKLTQSGRGIKGDFTGVGYPCHRTNTTLLFEGRMVDILMALRPLYRIIQNDILVLDEESLKLTGGRLLNVKFELSLVLPADRKRLLLQDSGRRCNQLRSLSGVDIIAGKQNFEYGTIKETIVTLHGFEESVEKACEWVGIFLQDSHAITSGDYMFMDYPKYTLAIPETSAH